MNPPQHTFIDGKAKAMMWEEIFLFPHLVDLWLFTLP